MEKQLKAWIYCRVLAPASRNLLNYQEEILSEIADDNSIQITGVLKRLPQAETLVHLKYNVL